MPRFVQHFENKPYRAEDEPRQKRTDGALAIQPRPEDAEDKADRDRRADGGLQALQVEPELVAQQMNVGNPQTAQNYHDDGSDATKEDEVGFVREWVAVFVELAREHR